ncbi:hypothetical protein LCGC14_2686700 [marine sediment metagenome]|uniref:Uncharacterized protein n=1 Tax=marine sediment metagenome TaxID=412755 RepID=A0A0F8ZJT5_9ZZZZ
MNLLSHEGEACCAHVKVSYRTETHDGLTHGWWECDSGCGTRFCPQNTEQVTKNKEK